MNDEVKLKKRIRRPEYNILRERNIALMVENRRQMPLELMRIVMVHKQKNWVHMYGFNKNRNGYVAWSTKYVPGESDSYRPYLDAENAMILCGRKSPHKRYDGTGAPVRRPTWYDEFYWFRIFCQNTLSGDDTRLASWSSRGQKPDPVAIYRTAICTLVARKMLKPKGCNPDYLPPHKSVSQVWYLLFGEVEMTDSIRKRMKTVGRFCKVFALEGRVSNELPPEIRTLT
jgi:hypothetical protein